MRNKDQLISALYLAKSDNRDKMLSDLIVNVIYDVGGAMPIEMILLFIKENFHLVPIEYEIQQCLDKLVEDEKLSRNNGRYNLLDSAKDYVYKSKLSSDSTETKRFESFKRILDSIDDFGLNEEETKKLWDVFNEYLLECFLVFGKKAINIFLPYKTDELNGDHNINSSAEKKLNSEKLIALFKILISEYPSKLNDAELRYLTTLANRAEKFYSLGITKEDYKKIKSLEIKDLIVLLDTNILYSILEFRKHPEDSAINEILRIANAKKIDLRLVYIPQTYKELQKAKNYLEKVIPRENFKVAHMRALIQSDKLDPFAKKYYEGKLENSDLPHPSQKIRYASDVLKTKSIIIYNNGFKKLEENEEYLNERIKDYYDFQKYYNKLCDEKGYDHTLYKDDKKIAHDVFLREAVKTLKITRGDENEMKFVCLTLDRSLIHFDHYIQRQNHDKNTGEVINPNFILPSLFIKKIRPFVPIETENYRKAFLSSIAAPNIEKENYEESLVVQKSMSFFKNLGIDDEEIIINCIKRELFFEEFTQHEKNSTTEDFIKTEIAIEIERIKKEQEELQLKSQQERIENEEKLKEVEKAKEKEISLQKESNQKLSIKADKLEEDVRLKEKSITALEERLTVLERDKERAELEKSKIEAKVRFNKKLKDWESKRDSYVSDCWQAKRNSLKKSIFYFLKVFLITIITIGLGIFLKVNDSVIPYLESNGIDQIYVWGVLVFLIIIEAFGRSYLYDKSKIKEGYTWLIANLNRGKKNKIRNFNKDQFSSDYFKISPKPELEE